MWALQAHGSVVSFGPEATEAPRAQLRQTTAEHREGGNCSVASRGRQQRPVRRIVLRSPI